MNRRRCRNCDELFERTKHQQRTKIFCSAKCRTEYFHYGFPVKRIKELVEKEVARQLNAASQKEVARQLKITSRPAEL